VISGVLCHRFDSFDVNQIAVLTRAYNGKVIDIVPNAEKDADGQPDFRVLSKGSEIGAGWTRRAKSSGNDYVSLSLAQPEFGPRRLYANLGRAAGAEDNDTFALIWNPQD